MASTIRGSDNFDSAGGNAVKAWVNFNGTGTVAIRASYNVSSITDTGTGDYTVNFTTSMVDANYSATGMINGTGSNAPSMHINNLTSSAAKVRTMDATAFGDPSICAVSIFR